VMFFDLPISANGPLATHQIGQPSYTTAAIAPAAEGVFGSIKGLLFDGSHIWVVDGVYNRVQRVALPF